MTNTSRRRFLGGMAGGAAILTFGTQAPGFLQAAVHSGRSDSGRSEKILVVIELGGGNDGLNTIVPFTDDDYRKHRPKLALAANEVLKISDSHGFHPSLKGFAELLQNHQLSIVQGVGYDNPNRSHFESMDIWHTCQRKEENRSDGWLGRSLEQRGTSAGPDPAGLHLGGEKQPFALMSHRVRVPSIRSVEQFRLNGTDSQRFRDAVKELADARRSPDNDLLSFVQSSTSSAISASERIEAAGKSYKAAVPYPETDTGAKLETVAKLISSGLGTSVYYLQLDGFDTHSQQPDAHAGLLRQLGDALSAFVKDLTAQGHSDRVLTMCFSEFGRRVAENASEGTDHGTAGPVFLAGSQVKPGLIGKHPSLSDLTDGDLRHHTDFRQVYATVLEQWMGCDSQPILKGTYNPVEALALKN